MCTPSCMDRIFINLKVISQLKEGQKIYTNGDYLVLDEGLSYKQTFTRWWLNESRERTLKKIQEVIKSSIYCGQNAINSETLILHNKTINNEFDCVEVRQWEAARDKHLQMDNVGLLKSLSREMEAALIGLNNLKETYTNDATLRAKLDLEVELVGRHIEKFKNFLESQKNSNSSKTS